MELESRLKNGVICLVIMSTPKITVIVMSKMADFFLFSADDTETFVTVCTKYLSAPDRFYLVLSECSFKIRLWSYLFSNVEGTNIKKLLNQQ